MTPTLDSPRVFEHDDGKRRAMDVLELRIHGIGPHPPWSSLGRPQVTRRLLPPDALQSYYGRKDELETSVPPTLPEHHVEMVNWSKSSRRNSRLLWYLALPFTLVNVARHMRSTETHRSTAGDLAFRAGCQISAFSLTVLATVWLMTLAENALFLYGGHEPVAHRAACGIVVMLLSGGTVLRLAARSGNTTRWPTAVAHSALVAVFGSACIVARPAQWGRPPWPYAWAVTRVPDPSTRTHTDSIPKLDFVAATSATVTVLCGAIAVIFSLVQLGERRRAVRRQAEPPTNLAAAGLLVAIAPLLLCVIGSVLRAAVALAVRLVRYLLTQADVRPRSGIADAATIVRPQKYPQFNRHYTLDLLSMTALGMLAGVAVAFVLVALLHPAGPRALASSDDIGPVSVTHRVCATLRQTVPWVLPVTFALWSTVLLVATALDLPLSVRWRALTTELTMDAILITVAVLVVGGLPAMREKISFVADLASFWPAITHPLGGSSYRPSVCAGLVKIIEEFRPRVLVLVGHSQGSVIAAWLLATIDDDERRSLRRTEIHLVTCGSPVESLYATFFPTEFDPSLFERVQRATNSWDNFWRSTDPIALPLATFGTASVTDHRLRDPATRGGKPLGHSDYWVDPSQAERIAEIVATAGLRQP